MYSRKTFYLDVLVNIPQVGTDLIIFTRNFTGVYMIAYGIMSKVSNIDPDKVYDYHTAFDIKKTQVEYNVDINANNKKILNIALDKGQDTSAATVGMVKELIPFTKNYVYRQYFKEFYDFTDANVYGLNRGASGIVINSLIPNISIPNKDLSFVDKDGLDVDNYNVSFRPSVVYTYSLYIVFKHSILLKTGLSNIIDHNFSLIKKNADNNKVLLKLSYDKTKRAVILIINKSSQSFTLPSNLKGKKMFYVW